MLHARSLPSNIWDEALNFFKEMYKYVSYIQQYNRNISDMQP
jgi:hypothetical protein